MTTGISNSQTTVTGFRHVHLHVPADGSIRIDMSSIAHAGLGLFAQRAFAAGEPITEYSGEIIEHVLATQRPFSHLRTLLSMTYVLDGLRTPEGDIVDPLTNAQTLGAAAFANDADGSCLLFNTDTESGCVNQQHENNCHYATFDSVEQGDLVYGFKPVERIVYLAASHNIEAGEELFVSYGRTYWARFGGNQCKVVTQKS